MDFYRDSKEKEEYKLKPLEFTGHFFLKGKRVISYLTPEYLVQYPTGSINFQTQNGGNGVQIRSFELCADSIIGIDYSDGDSLIWRYTRYIGGRDRQSPASFNYEPGFKEWEILSETKEIDGLKCQRARNYLQSGTVEWDVWFWRDIPVERGFSNTFGLPGLLVEGECIAGKASYKLLSYKIGEPIPESVFWPALFNKPFVHRGTIRNKNKM